MIKKTLFTIGSGLILSTAFAGSVLAQDSTTKTTTTTTVTKTVQNADGSYSVIEYPVGKEVMVELTPGANISGKGIAHIMRTGNETTVNLDLSGLPADASNYFVYAVDPTGKVTLLGPANISNGASNVSFKTPMNQFMLVLSPTEGLDTIGSDTMVTFRSSVPKGYAIVPTVARNDKKLDARTARVNSAYDVPLLGIPNFKRGTTKTIIKFSGKLQGVKGIAYITPTKGGSTKITMGFGNMKLGPTNARYVLWAVSPDKQYTKIGQAISTGRNDHSEIRGETILPDFGLFVTVEDADVAQPTGTMYSTSGVDR